MLFGARKGIFRSSTIGLVRMGDGVVFPNGLK